MLAPTITCPNCGATILMDTEPWRAMGRRTSKRKADANRAKASAYWADVRAGRRSAPDHHRKPAG